MLQEAYTYDYAGSATAQIQYLFGPEVTSQRRVVVPNLTLATHASPHPI